MALKQMAVAVFAVSALGACVSDEPFELKGEGKVFVSASLNTDVKAVSRATMDEIKEGCMLWISNSKGLVRRYNKFSEIPEGGIKLISDHYVAEAWAGDSVPASFTDRYFKGREEFTVTKGSTSSVTVVCRVANSVVKVQYADNVDDVLSDYVMTVGHSQGSLDFVGRTEDRGFFMMNSRDKNLTWTLSGTRADGSKFTRTGTIDNCKPATLYILKVNCEEGTVDPVGGAYLTIDVDETEITNEDVIEIPVAPVIIGYNFDLSQPVTGESGSIGRRSVFVTGSCALARVELACDVFSSMLGISGNDFELFGMSQQVRDKVEAGGINYVYNYDAEKDMSDLKLNFEETFTNRLADGEYAISITVTDANGKTVTGVLNINVSNAPVNTLPMTADLLGGVWTNRATVYGKSLKEGVQPGIKYRRLGTQAWTDAVLNGPVGADGIFAADIDGLEPGTSYEYVACTSDYIGGDIQSFVTEEARQIPESGFENWHLLSDKLWIIGAEGSETFWDSGNTALKSYLFIVKKDNNPTSIDETVKHSGNSSVRLKSINVAGIQFAAGNMFIGEFIRTDGTNGVIGWGRPWTSRPSKLKGWMRYEPAAITKENSDYPDLKKGDMDKGIVYIALLDNSHMEEDSGKAYPVIVKTRATERQLFDKNASNVIAYGELVLDGATAGAGMVEFEIPLTYRRNDVKPSYIMCTASASIGGDYFVGGEGSSLWLDDLELTYE